MSPTCFNATKNVGFKLGAAATISEGIGIKPVTRPKIVVAAIPMKMPPGTRRTSKIAVTTNPKIVNQVEPTLSDPNPTNVDSFETMIPPSLRPRKAINRPIPPEIAYFKSAGIASMIISRSLKIVIKIKIKEATNTPANAVSHGIPIPKQTE